MNPTRTVPPRPVVPADALTPEVPLVCNTVPFGGVVAMDVSAAEVEVQPSGSSTTPVRVVNATGSGVDVSSPSQESVCLRAACSKRDSCCCAEELQKAER